MIKALTSFAILLGVLFWFFVVGRLTNTLQYYVTPSPANEPTLALGEKFFATPLLRPKRLDFITYNVETPGQARSVWTHRLCGLPGDKVEIRQGQLYLNGQAADAGLNLAQHYSLSAPAYRALPPSMLLDTSAVDLRPDSAYHVALRAADAQHLGPKAHLQLLPPGYPDDAISHQYAAPWNQDNFGPYVVPAGHYFVLGDNRHNAYDSRYRGCIRQSDFVATVVGKH